MTKKEWHSALDKENPQTPAELKNFFDRYFSEYPEDYPKEVRELESSVALLVKNHEKGGLKL